MEEARDKGNGSWGEGLVEELKSWFPGSVLEVTAFGGREDELTITVEPRDIVKLSKYLKQSPELRFNYLADLTAVHYPEAEKPFQVVYHLYSMPYRRRLRLKVCLDEGEEAITVTDVWRTANFHEREAFDLMGVRFSGHRDLRRILMPKDWVGHPLRKDYPLEGRGEVVYPPPRR